MFTQEEINKLPKWAQNRINKIQSDIKYYSDKADEVAGEKETNVFINRYPNPLPLPKDSDIKFQFKEGVITCKIKNGCLDIHANVYNVRLAILPQVTNAITIKLINN